MKSLSPILAAVLLSFSSANAFAQAPVAAAAPESNQAAAQQEEAQPSSSITADTSTAPPAAALPQTTVEVTEQNLHIDSSWNRSQAGKKDPNFWSLKLYGFLRTGYTYQEGEKEAAKNGFFTAHARIGIAGSLFKQFGFKILFDGAGKLSTGSSLTKKPSGDIDGVKNNITYGVTLKDAYLTYQPFEFLTLRAGQFIPSFDYEGSASTSARHFINLSQGAKLSKGLREGGISVGASKYQPFDENSPLHDLGLTYEFSITNGTGLVGPKTYNLGFTTNLGANWGKSFQVGFGYYYEGLINTPTPTQGISSFIQSNFANINIAFSYVFKAWSINQATYAFTQYQHAFLTELQYNIQSIGLTPGIRYSFMDPTIENQGLTAQQDQTHEITLGTNWEYPTLPIKVAVNYTINLEQKTQVKNNQFGLLFQAKF